MKFETTKYILVLCALVGLFSSGCTTLPEKKLPEKKLFGFERQTVENILVAKQAEIKDRGEMYNLLDNGDFNFFHLTPGFHERELLAIRPMRCVQGKVSEGAYACKVAEVLDSRQIRRPSFRMPRIGAASVYRNQPQANFRLGELLNTAGWFDLAFPEDWSGYDSLRIDVLLESDEVEALLFEIEDDFVEPPVSLTYKNPAHGRWITLELDLGKAVKDRKLDLKIMKNIWLRVAFKDVEKRSREIHTLREKRYKSNRAGEIKEAQKYSDILKKTEFIAYIDNIRLCSKKSSNVYKVIKGSQSEYTKNLPRAYAVWESFGKKDYRYYHEPSLLSANEQMPKPNVLKPKTGSVPLLKPSVIPVKEMIAKGCMPGKFPSIGRVYPHKFEGELHKFIRLTCTSAFDSDRIAVGFYLLRMGTLRGNPKAERPVGRYGSATVGTLDGGKTWKGLDGNYWPTFMGGNTTKPPPRLVDLNGDVMGVYPFGCGAMFGTHIGYPTDRVFFNRSVMTKKGWWISPKYLVAGEARHCHWLLGSDVVSSPSGRLWSVWETLDRNSYEEISGYSPRFMAPYLYYSDDRGESWISWRGPGLTGIISEFGLRKHGMRYLRVAPYRGHVAVLGGNVWSWFNGKEWSPLEKTGLNQVWGAVSFGDEIYLTGASGPSRWYDGKIWQKFSVPGRTGTRGRIGVCGSDTLVFVETDKTAKTLLCWRKTKGGTWQGPQTLLTEEKEIVKIASQRYAPEGFLPIAYMCRSGEKMPPKTKGNTITKLVDQDPWIIEEYESWIKVLKVPAEG